MERNKIRHAAVQQAEKLASKYDMSGKLFNVGEVVIMPDGQAKSIKSLRKSAEVKEQRVAERQEKEKHNLAVKEEKKACNAPPTSAESLDHSLDGVNPQRAARIQTIHEVSSPNQGSRLSNKQRKTQEQLNPRSTLAKPVIPEGYKLPEDEENFIALWDLTDEEIKKRLDMAKQKAENARKALRRKQKEEKRFNQAMKVLKKQAANKGVLFDPELAKRTILGDDVERKILDDENSDSNSDRDSGSGSDSTSSSGSESESESESGCEVGTDGKFIKSHEAKPKSDADKSKNHKQFVEDTETKHRASNAPVESVKKKTKKGILGEKLDPEFVEKRLRKETKRLKKEQESVEKLATKLAKSQAVTEEPAKKRKRVIEAEGEIEPSGLLETTPAKKQKRNKVKTKELTSIEAIEAIGSEKKKHRRIEAIEPAPVDVIEVIQAEKKQKHKQKKSDVPKTVSNDHSITSENWNTDALEGDNARKQKFLRLLGAGKAKGDGAQQNKPSKKSTDISKVQSDLEKQYEAGMKLKHDGGSKRRGLGA